MMRYRAHILISPALLLLATLVGSCGPVRPYQQLYILAEEARIKSEIDATSCQIPEPSMASSSEVVPPAFPTIPLEE